MMLDTDPLVSTSPMPPHTRNRILGEPNHFAFCPGGVSESPRIFQDRSRPRSWLYIPKHLVFSLAISDELVCLVIN